jgi:hypothetical protein
MTIVLKLIEKDEKGKEILDENGNPVIKEKIFVVDHLRSRIVRKALNIYDTIDVKNMSGESLDRLANYVVEVYKNQFTLDDFYDGIDCDELMPTLTKCIKDVVSTMGAKLDEFPKTVETGK